MPAPPVEVPADIPPPTPITPADVNTFKQKAVDKVEPFAFSINPRSDIGSRDDAMKRKV